MVTAHPCRLQKRVVRNAGWYSAVPPGQRYFFQVLLQSVWNKTAKHLLQGEKHGCKYRVGGWRRRCVLCCEEPLVLTLDSIIWPCWAETPAAVWCSEAAESPHAACDGDNDFPHWDYYTAVSSLCTRPIKYAWMFEMNFGGSPLHRLLQQQQQQHQQPLLLPPYSPLSNYIIIFLSIKIRMNNLSIWQQPGSQRGGFGTAAGRQGCFWWAMHAKLTLPWRTPKRNNERKRRKNKSGRKKKNYIHAYTYSTLWNVDATTSNVRHRNTVADMKYATRPQQVEGPPSCRHTVSLVSQSWIPVKDSVRDTSFFFFFRGKKTQKKNKNGFIVPKHLESGGSSPAEALIKLCHRLSNVKSGNALWASITFSFMHFNPYKREEIWIIDSWGLIFLCHSSRRIYEIYGSLNLICGEWKRLQAHTHTQMQCMCVCVFEQQLESECRNWRYCCGWRAN